MYPAQGQIYLSEFEAKTALTDIAGRLYANGWMPAGDGSISVRTGKGTVWITSAGCDKKHLGQGELLRVDLRGSQSQVGRNGIPPDDLMTHLRIYSRNEAAGCVIHAYPPEATAYALQGNPLPAGGGTPSVRRLGEIRVIRMEDAFSAPEQAAERSLTDSGILLQNDGCLVWGATPIEACQRMEALEYSVNMMCKKTCQKCGHCPGCSGDCDRCAKGLKGVTPIVRPGDPIPDRKAASPVAAAGTGPAAPRGGKIPELTITAHRFTDREKQRLGQSAAPAAPEKPTGPMVHRFSDKANAPVRSAVIPSPAPVSPAPAAAPAAEARQPGVPVKDAPRDKVQAEVVRRLKGKL